MGNDQSSKMVPISVPTPQRSPFEIVLRTHLEEVLDAPFNYDHYDNSYMAVEIRIRSARIYNITRSAMEEITRSAAGTPQMTIQELRKLRKLYTDRLYKLSIIKFLENARTARVLIQRPNLLLVPLEYQEFKTKQINLARQRLENSNSKVEELLIEEKNDFQPPLPGTPPLPRTRQPITGYTSEEEFIQFAETPSQDGDDDIPYRVGDRLRRRNASEDDEIWTIVSRTQYFTRSMRTSYTYTVTNRANTMRAEWSHDGIRDRNLVRLQRFVEDNSDYDSDDDDGGVASSYDSGYGGTGGASSAGGAGQFSVSLELPDDDPPNYFLDSDMESEDEEPPVVDLAEAENIAYQARAEAEAAGVKCAICLNDFTQNGVIEAADLPEAEPRDPRQRFVRANQDYYAVKLDCGHYFHAACIRNMQSTGDLRCPFCRVSADNDSIPDGILRFKTKLRF